MPAAEPPGASPERLSRPSREPDRQAGTVSEPDAGGSGRGMHRGPTSATGIGSWPGNDVREAVVTVRDLLVDADALGIPYLPETPARGPGADLIGRAAGLLVDLPVDLQPSGWRLVDRPGHDASRTGALHAQDRDELAEAYDGYAGPLKVQIAGPWTLAASLQLNRGERVLADPGASRELTQSLAAGAAQYVAHVRRLVPRAEVILQIDEPSLPAVLAGRLPTASGYGRLRAVDPQSVADGLRELTRAHAGATIVHCCDADAPIPLLRSVGATALALDVVSATPARWESLAVTIEAGTGLYAGCLPTDGSGTVTGARDSVLAAVERVGLDASALSLLTLTPACGLADASVESARAIHRMVIDVARELTQANSG